MTNPKHRSGPAAYDPRVRLTEQVGDARQLLARAVTDNSRSGYPARCDELEALLSMICDEAGLVLGEDQR